MTKLTCPADPFRWFDASPEVIGLIVMVYVGISSPKFMTGLKSGA